MSDGNRILVTGAAGKVGQAFISRLLSSPDERFGDFVVRALCHNRMLEPASRLEVVSGSIEHRETAERAVAGATHVLHLATSKETPESIMDVAVKGLFWLLEACRASPTFEQFVLVGGDAGLGHFFYPHPIPVTETQKHSAYPGCYALSKVLEEVMLEQYEIQYDLNGCCLRAPWIMEKDDFKYQLSFGEDVFGGPRWRDLVGAEQADAYVESQTVPIMLDEDGRPVRSELRPRRRSRRRDSRGDRLSRRAPADLQRLHGRARRLRGARRLPRGVPRPTDCRYPNSVLLDLARQRQGEVPARLAAQVRPEEDDRRRLGLSAPRPTSHAWSGIQARRVGEIA